jgi:hypothetical protein
MGLDVRELGFASRKASRVRAICSLLQPDLLCFPLFEAVRALTERDVSRCEPFGDFVVDREH